MIRHFLLILLAFRCARLECPKACICSGTRLKCFQVQPSVLPDGVSEVSLSEIPVADILNFTDSSWHNVTYLSLSLGSEQTLSNSRFIRTLHEFEFSGLKNLKYLRIRCNCYLKIGTNAFYGLQNVRGLDLSNNTVSSLRYDIIHGLSGNNILPNISELFLSYIAVGSFTDSLSLLDLHIAMRNKPLKLLDLSGTRVMLFPPSVTERRPDILPQLKTLNVSRLGPTGLYLSYIEHMKNLQTLDVSYPFLPRTVSECNNYGYQTLCNFKSALRLRMPITVTQLYAKHVFRTDIELRGTSNSTHLCIFTNVSKKNTSICLTGRLNHIQKLVVPENSVTYIQPDLFQPFERLVYLDLSRNELGEVISNDTCAQLLFNELHAIETLLLSNNGIKIIPKHTFRNNRYLKILDLSCNNLETVNFGINDLMHLEHLDISFNNISVLDSASCSFLKALTFGQKMSFNSSTSHINTKVTLDGNPISCSCENVCFLEYILELNETHTCFLELEDKIVVINDLSLRKSMYMCKRSIVIGVFSTLSVIMVILIAVTTYFVIHEKRKIRLKRLKETGIEMYDMNPKKRAVFLSFSGDDEDFVMKTVLPNLESGLKRVLNTENDCVLTGATSFRLGYSIKDEILRCIEQTSVVMFFLSDTFFKKPWCRNELYKAFCENKHIVLMIWGKVNVKQMPRILRNHFETYTRVHWSLESGDPVMTPGWDQLCEDIVRLIGKNTN